MIAWIGAGAAWSAAVVQYANLQRLRVEDAERWVNAFSRYRRRDLPEFAKYLKIAYDAFRAPRQNGPATWELATHQARWLNNVPVPGRTLARDWRYKYGSALPPRQEHLFTFAESIYPPAGAEDPRPLAQRSILQGEDFTSFNARRGAVADYFLCCGLLYRQSPSFKRFAELNIRPNHYPKLKIISYLELALERAITPHSGTGKGKVSLFWLGNHWRGDDANQQW